MTRPTDSAAADAAVQLAAEFLRRVWTPPHDLRAIDELTTEDYVITSGGTAIAGRAAFRAWVEDFQRRLLDARTTTLELFADGAGRRVVARWRCAGRNNGIFGLAPDGRPVAFTGIAIWAVRGGRLAECWVERSALEAYRQLGGAP